MKNDSEILFESLDKKIVTFF